MTTKNFSVGEMIHNGPVYDRVNSSCYDLPFWVEMCRRALEQKNQDQPKKNSSLSVLELCCGTGRITIPLARELMNSDQFPAFSLTGLDFTDSMLDRAIEKRDREDLPITLIRGDMRDFSLDQSQGAPFDLIFIPFNSFLCLYTIEECLNTLARVKAHLTPGGLFVLDIFNPSIHLMVNREKGLHPVCSFTDQDGQLIEISEQCHYDDLHQVNRVKWFHRAGDRVFTEQLDMRCIYPLEAELMLRHAGFTILERFGGHDMGPVESGSMLQIHLCQKELQGNA